MTFKDSLFVNFFSHAGFGLALISVWMIMNKLSVSELMIINLIAAAVWAVLTSIPILFRKPESKP